MRKAQGGAGEVETVPHRRVQPQADQPDDGLVGNERGEPPYRQFPVDRGEEALDIGVQQPAIPLLIELVDPFDRHPHRPPAPVGEAAFVELRFEKRLHVGRDGRLEHAVADGRHDERPPLLRPRRFLDLDLPQRPGEVRLVLHHPPQEVDLPVEIGLEVGEGDVVDARAPVVLADAQEGAAERTVVQPQRTHSGSEDDLSRQKSCAANPIVSAIAATRQQYFQACHQGGECFRSSRNTRWKLPVPTA